MKKLLTLLLIFLLSLPVFCQRGQKIESLKVGYLTNKLNLDPKTAERFWPVYHQYEDELMDIVRERRMNQQETRNAEEILDQEQKALDVKRKYTTTFSKIISGEQLNQLYKAEQEFRQMIINRSQQREMRQNNMQDRGPAPLNRNDRRMEDKQQQRMESKPLRTPQNDAVRPNRLQPQPTNTVEKMDRMRR